MQYPEFHKSELSAAVSPDCGYFAKEKKVNNKENEFTEFVINIPISY
jgi:hypothetical protein